MSKIRKANTFCYLLWERAFINECGEVFFCCHCMSRSVGNIYEHDLAYIWQKSEKAKLYRAMALNGSLSCYPGCTILSKADKSRKDREFAVGRSYRIQGKLVEAEAAFKDVLGVEPKNQNIYFELGLLYKEQSKLGESIASFKKALKLGPGNPDAYFELGWLYKGQGKLGKAEASFKQALKLEPRNPDVYVGLGWLYKEGEKYNEAGALFREALKLDPRNSAAYAELGWLYKVQGKSVEAKTSFEKALKLDPNAKSACLGLGWLYKGQGRLELAEQLLRKAAKLNPQDRNNANNTDYPSDLHITTGTFCHIKCIMCSQKNNIKTALNNDKLKTNIDWSKVDHILLHGGEVLAMPGAKELLIWLIERKQKKIQLITNGLLINREWANRLVRGSQWLEVSVNAATKKTHELVNRGSDFSRVIRNLNLLIGFKRKLGATTDIRYHFTIVPENLNEIAQAIKFADKLGCGTITYSFDSPNVENYLFKHEKIRKRIRDDIVKQCAGNLKIKILRNQLEQLGLVRDLDSDLFIDEY